MTDDQTGTPAGESTEFDGEFDAERAKKLITNLRTELSSTKSKLQERTQAEQQAARAAQTAQAAALSADEQIRASQIETQKQLQAMFERTARSEIKAFAADKFADPDDAALHLKAADYIDANGDVNTFELQRDVDDLLRRKPHLAKPTGTTSRAPAPDGSQGRHAPVAQEPRDQFAAVLQQQLGIRPT